MEITPSLPSKVYSSKARKAIGKACATCLYNVGYVNREKKSSCRLVINGDIQGIPNHECLGEFGKLDYKYWEEVRDDDFLTEKEMEI